MNIKQQLDGECLNCGSNLQIDDQFCPRCGQKVDRNDLRLGSVFSEFFENYLSFDTRLGRTIIPFFFKPGYLTAQFINGVRRNYANPFRLYIFSSIFFFFCLSSKIGNSDSVNNEPIIKVGKSEMADFKELSADEKDKLSTAMPSVLIDKVNKLKDSSFVAAIKQQDLSDQQLIYSVLDDSSLNRLGLLRDTLSQKRKTVQLNWTKNDDNSIVNMDINFDKIKEYRYNKEYTDEMLYDSLMNGMESSWTEELILKRAIHVYRADSRSLTKFIIGNLSLAMFVLIPLFALFLKLFYYRRNKYYVAHLIHTIYLQSFAFILFGLTIFIFWVFNLPNDAFEGVLKFLTIVFAVYFIISFRKIYHQAWWRLILKSFTLFFIYFVLAAVVILLEILVSFLLF